RLEPDPQGGVFPAGYARSGPRPGRGGHRRAPLCAEPVPEPVGQGVADRFHADEAVTSPHSLPRFRPLLRKETPCGPFESRSPATCSTRPVKSPTAITASLCWRALPTSATTS